MVKKQLRPDYIFESSWEVCNKVGGIYTVLSTRAKTLQEALRDKIIFIGPDFWKENESPYFKEESSLFADWQWEAKNQGLKIRVGRWTVPGEPIAILVDFNPYFEKKNDIYGWLWENYGVDSLHAYGDYDEASMFSYAAALVVESFYNHYLTLKDKVIYHANEWMCGLGALYINNKLPQIGTIFTQVHQNRRLNFSAGLFQQLVSRFTVAAGSFYYYTPCPGFQLAVGTLQIYH